MSTADSSWTCRLHESRQPDNKTYCPECMEAFRQRRDVVSMTVDERIAELHQLEDQLTIPFGDVHQRITELMGRDVWTHEMAYPEQLYEELRNDEHIGIADVIAKLPQDKPVIVVTTGESRQS